MYAVRVASVQLPELTPLHRAAIQGDLPLVSELLRANVALNIYATNANDEALLADVIQARQSAAAQLLLDMYEADLFTLTQWFRECCHTGDADFQGWPTMPVLVACGQELCDAVECLVTDSIRLPRVAGDQPVSSRQCLIVLLKRDHDTHHHQVLWLSPSAANTADDKRTLARIIESIYVERNSGGLLDVHDLLALAAHKGLPDVFFRLHSILVSYSLVPWDKNTDFMPLLCFLAQYKIDTVDPASLAERLGHFQPDDNLLYMLTDVWRQLEIQLRLQRVDVFQHMLAEVPVSSLRSLADRLGRFRLDDDSLYMDADAWRMLEIPLRLLQTHVFEYLLNEIARVQARTPGTVINMLIQNSRHTCLLAQWHKNEANLEPFVGAWLRHSDVDLLHQHSLQPTCCLLLMLCRQVDLSDEWLVNVLVRCTEHLISDAAKRLRRDVFSCLVSNARLGVLRGWFMECPQMPKLVHADSFVGYNHMFDCIGPNAERMAMAEFLLDSFAEQLSERSVRNVVLQCAEWSAANGMLRKLLALPQCVDVADGWEMWGDARSPLFTALIGRSVQNFDVLFESVHEKAVICAMKEYNDDCILAAAIWSPTSMRNQFLYAGYMVEDEDEDACDTDDKKATATTCRSATDLSIERSSFERIFEQLLDIGCDPLAVNATGETLLHFAVSNDNLPMLERLLQLGVDPMQADKQGYVPLHAVRSVPVLRALLTAAQTETGRTVPELLAQRAANGTTPLAAVFGRNQLEAATMALLDAMRSAGADCNVVVCNTINSTLLHSMLTSVRLTKWLLAADADINALNANGETPLSAQLIYNRIDIIKLLLTAPTLDWSLLIAGSRGAAFLGWLVGLNAGAFERIRSVLLPAHEADLAELFRGHCNAIDSNDIPVLHTALRSDTNAHCLHLLLQQRDAGLSRTGIVMASCGDPAAMRLAIELCDTAADREANFTPAVLQHALGHPSFAEIVPCVPSVRALLSAGVPADGVHVRRVLQSVGVGRRRAVLTIVAALVAAGAKVAGEDEPALKGTALQFLFEG